MSKIDELGAQLHLELFRIALDRIKSGEATAADLNVARQLLKDNGIDGTTKQNPHMIPLAEVVLPYNEEDNLN